MAKIFAGCKNCKVGRKENLLNRKGNIAAVQKSSKKLTLIFAGIWTFPENVDDLAPVL